MFRQVLLGFVFVFASSGLALASDYFTVYQTYEEAAANCDPDDQVMPYYDFQFTKLGYICQQRNSGS
jgi:hypothetical protein